MLLPELTIFISTKTFETNFEYFFNKYVTKQNIPNLSLKKSDIVSSGYRYTIHFGTQESSGSTPTRVGEIDVIPIHEGKIKFQAAVYNFEKLLQPLLFFNEFYNFIFANWEVDPRDRNHGYDDELATSEWISIGWNTCYFYLPEVIQDISKLLEDNFGYSLSEGLEFYKDHCLSNTNLEREEILKKYRRAIDEGLPKEYGSDLFQRKRRSGVSETTLMRAQRLKEIKDSHLHWTQNMVVDEYNYIHEGDDKINTNTLRNVYRAMKWEWQRADRMS